MSASHGMHTEDAARYSSSTIALDENTGELAWYYQHAPSEAFDLDVVFECVLVDDGYRKLLFLVGKDGRALENLDHAERVFQRMGALRS
jgi:alcohol dehydrogenase (cytochrome c)